MSEQAGTSKSRGLRDWVTITQGALLLVAIILIGTLMSGAGRPRAARAQGPGGPGGGFQGGPQGPFGRGPMGQQEQKLVKQFDKNKDDRLDNDERKAARAWLAENGGGGRGFGGGRRGGGRGMAAGSPGRALKPADVKSYGNEPLYDPAVLRTIFLQFENDDWEQELAAFNNTDVEVPAVVTVDGRTYRNVGVHFRGMSSFFMVPAGSKRSLNLTFDFVDEKQSLLGYRTLNLLNVNGDPTFVRSMLYSDIARSYIPAPKTNYLRVGDQRRELGRLHQRAAVQQGLRPRLLQDRAGRTLEGAGQPGRPRRHGVLGRRSLGVQADLRHPNEGRPEGLGFADPDVQGPERDATRQARSRALAAARYRRRAAVPGGRQRAGQYRRLLDACQRLQHLPGREGAVPRHPSRHERGADQRGWPRPWPGWTAP